MTIEKGCYRAFDATMDAIAIKLLTAALRHSGRSADFCDCSEADVRREVMNGAVWWLSDIRLFSYFT